jgi:hypothetical protein
MSPSTLAKKSSLYIPGRFEAYQRKVGDRMIQSALDSLKAKGFLNHPVCGHAVLTELVDLGTHIKAVCADCGRIVKLYLRGNAL